MKTIEILSVFFVILPMVEGRLENILSLMPEETRTIAENLYRNAPGTLAKFLEPTNINFKVHLDFTKTTLNSHVHLTTNDDLVIDLQKEIQMKFDNERMTLNLSEILSERIGKETLNEFESKSAKIIQFDGEYIEEETTYWSDVIYYVYGDVNYEISKNPLLDEYEWLMKVAQEYVPERILLVFESLLEKTYHYRFVLMIEINGLAVRTKKMIELSDLIKKKDFNGSMKFLQSEYEVMWDNL